MLFRIQGRVLDSESLPIPHLRLVVVDDDDDSEDDLLGIGRTNEDGVFRMSFTRAEFNQDPGEDEQTPDLRIVFSTEREDTPKAIHQATFPDLVWPPDAEVDLGDITIASWISPTETPTLPNVSATPGHRPLGLPIDRDLVHTCLAEIAPLVEDLTGWLRLTEDLNIALIGQDPDVPTPQDLHNATLRFLLQDHPDADRWFDTLQHLPTEPFHVHFDPVSATLYIHTARCQTDLNRDAFTLHLGRALVRVGQTRNHPDLLTLQRSTYQHTLDTLSLLHAQNLRPDLRAMLRRSAYHTVMCDLEGYAHHIYEDFLKTHYPITDAFPPHILPAPNNPLNPPQVTATDLQRVLGRLVFAQHRSAHRPAPFATRAISILERDMRPIESKAALFFLSGDAQDALELLDPLYSARRAFLPSLIQRNSEVAAALVSCLLFTHDIERANTVLHETLGELQTRYTAHHPNTLSFLTATSAAFRIYATWLDDEHTEEKRLALLHARILHAPALETQRDFLTQCLNIAHPETAEILEDYLGEVLDLHQTLASSDALDESDLHPDDPKDLKSLLEHASNLHLQPNRDPWPHTERQDDPPETDHQSL